MVIRIGLIALVVLSIGCATQGQGSSGGSSGGTSASTAPASSGGGGGSGHPMLTEEDYRRIGIKEMGSK